MTSSGQPTIAIVIPIYGHPSLLIDALESALRQQTTQAYRIVLVNDGCPSPQSERVCRDYARTHPERILYLHKRNGGLSSARNRGIRLALATWPSVRAIYLLDADNRLQPHVLERSYALLQTNPGADWIFPDVHQFGSSREFQDTDGGFTRLQLATDNYCEAGSMVRREVFERGIAYDETMTKGFEDWDFWLSCAAAGFRGKHGPALGFRYRKRPESMLANSQRERAQIIAYMRSKHARLYAPKQVQRDEQREMPRFAIYLTDRNELILTSDCEDLSRLQTWEEFTRDLRRNRKCPQLQAVPPTVVITSTPALRLLQARGLAANLFWLLEADLEAHRVFVLHVEQQMGIEVRYELSRTSARGSNDPRDGVLCALRSALLADCLQDPNPEALTSILEERDQSGVVGRRLRIEHLERPTLLPDDACAQLCAAVADLRPAYRAQPMQRLNPRRIFYRVPSDAGLIWQRLFQAPAPPPLHRADNEPHLGFVVSVAEFGAVERVVCNLARETKRQGWRPHLFVLGSGVAHLLAEFHDTFASVQLLPDETLTQPARLVSLLGTMDVVVNNQSVFLNAALGDLRRLGVKLVSHVQSLDRTPDGAPCGHAYQTLQYEHSLHKVLVPAIELKTFLLAKGIPPDKMVLAHNAPGSEIPPPRLEAALAERAACRAGQPLRVLFLGRFDRKHGLDRLVAMVRDCERCLPEIAWRIIGKPIRKEDIPVSVNVSVLEKHRQPPALDAYTLSRHYSWADVLVMPSRWGGAPLTILEAQQFGCVPIATKCGAVSELIEDGQTGFLLENVDNLAAFVEQVLEQLTVLQRDRRLLLDVAERAAAVRRAQTWRHTLSELTACLDAWFSTQGAV